MAQSGLRVFSLKTFFFFSWRQKYAKKKEVGCQADSTVRNDQTGGMNTRFRTDALVWVQMHWNHCFDMLEIVTAEHDLVYSSKV